MRRLSGLFLSLICSALLCAPTYARKNSLLAEFEALTGQHATKHARGHRGGDVPDPRESELSTECKSSFFAGQAPRLVNPKLASHTRELCNPGYAVLHSGVTRTPLWSAEHLTPERIRSSIKLSRQDSFRPDERLPASERAELDDYARSGFDRGHMSPNKDAPDRASQAATFLLSNMIPQVPEHNQQLWEAIERSTRELALDGHDVWVVTGASFLGDSLQRTGRVGIPTHVWKAIYLADSKKAMVWWTENTAGWSWKTISVEELAQRAGVDAFPAGAAEVRAVAARLPLPRRRG